MRRNYMDGRSKNSDSIMRRPIETIRPRSIFEFWQREYLRKKWEAPDPFFPMWNRFLHNGRKANPGSRKNLRFGFVWSLVSGRHIRFMRGAMEKYSEVGPVRPSRRMRMVGLRLWFRKAVRSI